MIWGMLANKRFLTFGIQGGVGSFNEQMIIRYLDSAKISKYKISYLYTSERVLSNLNLGNIDYGLFAIHNSVGGIVDESIHAMANYKFKIVSELKLPIQHYLMKRPEVDRSKITTIMAHPQVFKQCQATLVKKYPSLKLISGKGDLIDTARAAQALSKNQLSKVTAILGPKTLAGLYNLEIIDQNLQDNPDNLTSFLLVSR